MVTSQEYCFSRLKERVHSDVVGSESLRNDNKLMMVITGEGEK